MNKDGLFCTRRYPINKLCLQLNEYRDLTLLVSTGNFSDGTLLDQGSLDIITFEELKKSLPGGKNTF